MNEDPLKQIGEFLKEARLKSNIGLEELSEKSKIPLRFLDNIEQANRSQLPEGAYLIGYLNKIAKLLNIQDYQRIIEEYKNIEGQFILQSILNENHIQMDFKPVDQRSIKSILIIVLIVVLFFGVFYLLATNEIEFGSQVSVENNKEYISQEVSTRESLDPKDFVLYGNGSKSLKLEVVEVAWFHVYGIAAAETLYEGEAYPNVSPNKFEFRDDIGFSLSSGNAGAFKIYDNQKNYILGYSGKLIKWFYPKEAQLEYEQQYKKRNSR